MRKSEAVLETQEDESQKPKTWHDAQCLCHSLCKTEIATMIFIWNSLSDRLHAINKNLQNVNLDIYLEDKIYESLYLCFQSMWTIFNYWENKGRMVVDKDREYQYNLNVTQLNLL
jgi:hypothetical protein